MTIPMKTITYYSIACLQFGALANNCIIVHHKDNLKFDVVRGWEVVY